jgi:hypothetical protein
MKTIIFIVILFYCMKIEYEMSTDIIRSQNKFVVFGTIARVVRTVVMARA